MHHFLSNLFWNKTLHVSEVSLSIIKSFSLYELQFHPEPARKLSAKLYDIHHCCVYSEKLLIMDKETYRNM
jgi:hypothetical protein